MTPEEVIENTAFSNNMTLPEVRDMFDACDELQRAHGDGWADHFEEAVLASVRSGATWHRAMIRDAVRASIETVALAAQTGGDPHLALQEAQGMSQQSAAYVMDIIEEIGRERS
uniref:hypothetical protein n=1 Tax=Streptomyces sp. CA-136453 TaxID=3240050 RepID=UPI003F4967BB